MTYRAWNTKTGDRAALKELTAAIAQQNTRKSTALSSRPSRKKPACWPASSLPGASPTPPRR